MAHRDVPQSIITEVHPGNLLHVGASSATARLKKASFSGIQEQAALDQTQYAVSSLRLVNSNILSMSSMRQLLNGVIDQVDYLADEHEDSSRFDNVRSDLELMSKAMVDMDNGNGDLLKVTALQFNDAHRSRANAWLDSTRLPAQMKKELKILPQPASVEAEGHTPLFSEQVLATVHQHVQSQKDNVWRYGAKVQQGSKPKSMPKKKSNRGGGGGFSGHASNWQQNQQSGWQSNQNFGNQPHGGGQQPRDRGRGGGGHGRGGFSGNQASPNQK